MKAIIPAAGLGTRFLPGTKCTPKEMLPVLDKPVIQYVVEEALDPEEVDDAIIVTSPGKPELLNYFQPDRSLENLLRERGKNAYADAVAHAGGMPVDFRYQYEPKGLAELVAKIEATGGDPREYVEIKYSVSEAKFKAWPQTLRAPFEALRTVTPKAPKFVLRQAGEGK